MKIRFLALIAGSCVLVACGGDDPTPTSVVTPTTTLAPAPAPTPTPTPTPAPSSNHSGTYRGTLTFNVQGGPEVPMNARLEVTHEGDTVDLGELEVPGFGTFPLKTATMTSATEFEGSSGYQSIGCGRVKVSTSGSFGDRTMDLLAGLTSDCFHARFKGELTR